MHKPEKYFVKEINGFFYVVANYDDGRVEPVAMLKNEATAIDVVAALNEALLPSE